MAALKWTADSSDAGRPCDGPPQPAGWELLSEAALRERLPWLAGLLDGVYAWRLGGARPVLDALDLETDGQAVVVSREGTAWAVMVRPGPVALVSWPRRCAYQVREWFGGAGRSWARCPEAELPLAALLPAGERLRHLALVTPGWWLLVALSPEEPSGTRPERTTL